MVKYKNNPDTIGNLNPPGREGLCAIKNGISIMAIKNLHFLLSLIATLLGYQSTAWAQSVRYDPFYYPNLIKHADSTAVDFSAQYRLYMTPDNSMRFEDLTHELLEQNYSFDNALFDSEFLSCESPDQNGLSSFNGILGQNYSRIQIFIDPEVEQTDSLTFRVKGKSKVQNNICDFTGEINIENIYRIWPQIHESDTASYCVLIANYRFDEDKAQPGSGVFQGIYGTYCHIDKTDKRVCLSTDSAEADGYNNRNYVGTWESCQTGAVKKCIWGEYRLPYTFDFDIGDGEMRVNPKYDSPEWRVWQDESFCKIKESRWWEQM